MLHITLKKKETNWINSWVFKIECKKLRKWVFVCVREREREREIQRNRETERERHRGREAKILRDGKRENVKLLFLVQIFCWFLQGKRMNGKVRKCKVPLHPRVQMGRGLIGGFLNVEKSNPKLPIIIVSTIISS